MLVMGTYLSSVRIVCRNLVVQFDRLAISFNGCWPVVHLESIVTLIFKGDSLFLFRSHVEDIEVAKTTRGMGVSKVLRLFDFARIAFDFSLGKRC